jgi:hypothetical protein
MPPARPTNSLQLRPRIGAAERRPHRCSAHQHGTDVGHGMGHLPQDSQTRHRHGQTRHRQGAPVRAQRGTPAPHARARTTRHDRTCNGATVGKGARRSLLPCQTSRESRLLPGGAERNRQCLRQTTNSCRNRKCLRSVRLASFESPGKPQSSETERKRERERERERKKEYKEGYSRTATKCGAKRQRETDREREREREIF